MQGKNIQKSYGDISLIPQEIINTYLHDENTTAISQKEELINHTAVHKNSNSLQAAASITASSNMNRDQLDATVNDINLSGPISTKLLMQL